MDNTDMTPIGQPDMPFEQNLPTLDRAPPTVAPSSRTRRPRGPTFWIVLILLLAAGYFGYRKLTQTQNDAANQAATGSHRSERSGPQPVGVATVGPRDIHVVIAALGTTTPLATVTVVSQISGVLQQVGFTEGQKVAKGDFLAQVDDRPYRALKAQYEGQLAHDQGLLDQARKDDIRYAALLKQNSIARQTAEGQQYVVKQYEGTVAADKAQVDAQALNIAYCHILSPVDGRVGLRLIDPGNYITASTASASTSGIVVVTQMQPMSVVFSIPEDSLNRVAAQLRAGEKLSTEVYDRANVKLLAKGETRALDNQVDTTTGMVKLRAFFDNADEALFPNQFVNVRLLASTIARALAAPIAGIQHGAPGDYAWVIDADNKVSVKTVKLGQVDGDIVQILGGLNDGDRIVVDGADRLREGGEVRLVSGDNAATPAQDAGASQPAGPDRVRGADKAPESDAAREERRKKYRERNGGSRSGGGSPSGASPANGQ
jgi:multidrug efflux system membrane fusion protein